MSLSRMTDSPLRKSLVSIKEPLPITAQNRVRVAQGRGQVKRGPADSAREATFVTLAQQPEEGTSGLAAARALSLVSPGVGWPAGATWRPWGPGCGRPWR